jgi:GR25 family glycosyltransferase involved in LPS biosynthesis
MGMKLETVVKNRHFPLPDLIKIDVQGAELDILKSSMSIINCAKFLIVELQHTEYNRGAPLCNQTRDFLIENGWEVYAEKFSNNGPDADWCFINRNRNGNINRNQPVSPPAYKTVVINLKRRSDRKVMMESRLQAQNITEYEFMDAVDGSQLLPTAYIQQLFHGNNFNYRKGVIGCAMSHLALWQRLMHDTSCDMYVVMEDDAELVDDFELKLRKAVKLFASEPGAELCFISGFSITDPCTNANNLQLIKKNNRTIDGTGGYLIKKSGAVRFVDYYSTHSIKVAIDAAIVFDFNEHLYEVNHHLIKSPFFGPDTDIHTSYDTFTFPATAFPRPNEALVIGFHSNQLCERGTEVALFDYAFYNQTLYGNTSIIFYNKNNPGNNTRVIHRFESHFKCYAYNDFSEIDNILISEGADYFYSIGQGMDLRMVSACPNCLHDVFQMHPHGERYATVSKYLSLSFNRPDIPFVPHIVHFRNESSENFREILGIPDDAFVFGRYGGFNQFDITYVHEAICEFIQTNANVYFIFANTRAFCEPGHPRIVHVDTLYDETDKIKFINTCDAMIHARSDGETFGLSVAEFSIKNKPVVTTYSSIPNSDAHIDMLGECAVIYRSKPELMAIFQNIKRIAASRPNWNAYAEYTPESVMRQFMEVFIKPITRRITSYVTVAFCDWWNEEYCGGTFNPHDNFFVNLIKTHCGDNVVVTTVSPSQTPDVLFYSVFGQSNVAYHAGRKVFYAGEPVPHRPNADFNITFDASNAINTRLPLWVCYFDHAILTPNRFPPIPKREKFCSYIATNPRANRETFVEQLSSQYKRVDCGGKHLNNIGGAIPPGTNASGKIEHNKQYKFAIAFENTQYPGYVTEKICDVYKSGCIPIYWGTPDIIKDFNPSTFINANDFPDLDALIDHIRRVDCDDALYASYFKDPVLSDEWMQIFADPNRAFFKQLVSDVLKG